jgi:excinuclease ABC subunit B
VNGKVIMYADRHSSAMLEAVEETNRRRRIQADYNKAHGITPKTISKAVQDILVRNQQEKQASEKFTLDMIKQSYNVLIPKQRNAYLKVLENEMMELAKDLEFERAAVIRDEINRIKEMFQ